MLNSNEILGSLGVKRGTSVVTMLLIIMMTVGLGMFSSFYEKVEKGELTLSYSLIAVFLIFIPIAIFFFQRSREIKMISVPAEQKRIVIMTFPSNIGLLKKSLNLSENVPMEKNKFGVEQIFFLKTKDFPSKDIEVQILDFVHAYGIKSKKIILNNIENPREIQVKFETIVGNVNSTKNCAVNITPGKSTTSIFLYELAQQSEMEVQYISSKYDKNNNPIDGTEQLTKLQYSFM